LSILFAVLNVEQFDIYKVMYCCTI